MRKVRAGGAKMHIGGDRFSGRAKIQFALRRWELCGIMSKKNKKLEQHLQRKYRYNKYRFI